MFWFILYNGVLLPVLTCIVFLAAIFLPKVREGLKGRFQTYKRLKLFLEKNVNNRPKEKLPNSQLNASYSRRK